MKSVFTTKIKFILALLFLLLFAGFCGFRLGTQDLKGAIIYGSILLYLISIIVWELREKENVKEETIEKEELIQAMQIYNRNCIEDPAGFLHGIDESRKCAEYQVEYLEGIIKGRLKNIEK